MRRMLVFAIALIGTLLVTVGGGTVTAGGTVGAVFTINNSPIGNRVLVYAREANGHLTAAGSVATGGLGTGTVLDTQNGLVLSPDGKWLYAANPGSDEVSVFKVNGTHLTLVEVEYTRGDMPLSVTVHGQWLYVVNGGNPNGIQGFLRGHNGHLTLLPGSARPLSGAGTLPVQIQFNPAGTKLVVTERDTDLILRYPVNASGAAGGPFTTASEGDTPFGFDFTTTGKLIVSEAVGANPDASSVSSYRFKSGGGLATISASVPDHETAACWIAITPDDAYAYTTNNGSGTVSGYAVASDGSLTLLDSDGKTGVMAGNSLPFDERVTPDGEWLYVLASGTHKLVAFKIHSDGSLTIGPKAGPLPNSANGLAVR